MSKHRLIRRRQAEMAANQDSEAVTRRRLLAVCRRPEAGKKASSCTYGEVENAAQLRVRDDFTICWLIRARPASQRSLFSSFVCPSVCLFISLSLSLDFCLCMSASFSLRNNEVRVHLPCLLDDSELDRRRPSHLFTASWNDSPFVYIYTA